jgi:CTP:molybdopterin cytidylyltransferase MocA
MMPARCHVLNVIGGCALLPDLVVAVVAAGASRRLGRAKQLVPVGGEPLLRRQCRCALSARVGEVVAILGCDEAQHRKVIVDLPVDVRVNDKWAEGLAATLRSAVRAAKERQAALLVLPCDQYRYHDDVLGLHGDIGARSLFYHSRRPCPDEIANPRAAFDLDSPEEIRTAEAWAACQA